MKKGLPRGSLAGNIKRDSDGIYGVSRVSGCGKPALPSAGVSLAHTAVMAMQDSFLSHLISFLSLLSYYVKDMIRLLFNIVYYNNE
jgi:hypothetical protein